MTATWHAVIPMKGLCSAKSRLSLASSDLRQELALAMLLDTVEAVLACEVIDAVTVVSNDAVVRREVHAVGACVADDRGSGDVNVAVQRAMSDLCTRQNRVIILGALPSLRPADLAEVLGRAEHAASMFVADACGTGTTMLTQAGSQHAIPRFGAGSARLHRMAGALPVTAAASVRRDVDTDDDLADAVLLGVGRRTSQTIKGRLGSQRCA